MSTSIITKMAILWRERIIELNVKEDKYNVPNIENLVYLMELQQITESESESEAYFKEILIWCLKVSSVSYDSFYDEQYIVDSDEGPFYDGSGNEDEEGLY
jgi:hypothetical protein